MWCCVYCEINPLIPDYWESLSPASALRRAQTWTRLLRQEALWPRPPTQRDPPRPRKGLRNSSKDRRAHLRARHLNLDRRGTDTHTLQYYITLHNVAVANRDCLFYFRFGDDIPGMEGLGTGEHLMKRFILYVVFTLRFINSCPLILCQISLLCAHGRRLETWSSAIWPNMALSKVFPSCPRIFT